MDFLNHIPNYVSKDIFSTRCKEKLPFHLPSPISLGNIHVLRKHKGGREGVSQMLTIAYVGGGGAKGSCLHNHILEKK